MTTIHMINQIVLWERRLEIESNRRNIIVHESSSVNLSWLKFPRKFQKDSHIRSSAKSGVDLTGSPCHCPEKLQKQYLK